MNMTLWRRLIDRTMLTIFHLYYLKHPRAALHYARVQAYMFGWRWIFGIRRWNGRVYAVRRTA